MALQQAIWEWVRTLSPWQSDLVRRLCARTELTADELNEVKSNLLVEHDLPATAYSGKPVQAQLSDIPADAVAVGSVRLLALGNLKNIGAVEPGQRLTFARHGLTVIYGDNGAGKSSYARMLKQACRATDTSTRVLSNVFAPESLAGEATIDYEEAGAGKTLVRRANTPPDPVLSTVSVFDSGAARLYTANENEIAYIPSGLTLFQQLAQAQNLVRQLVQEEIGALQRIRPTFNESEFIPDTSVKQILLTLSDRIKPEEVRNLGAFTQADEEQLLQLDKTVATIRAADPKRTSQELTRKAEEATQLKGLLDRLTLALSDEAVQRAQEKDLETEASLQAARIASTEAFTNEPLRGVGSSPWKILWEAARKFSVEEAYPTQAFPVTEGNVDCVLCHQSLTDEAKDRFRRFEAFVQNRAEAIARNALAERDQVEQQLLTAPVAALEALSIRRLLRDEYPDLATLIDAFDQSARSRLEGVKVALKTHQWSEIPVLTQNPGPSLAVWAEARQQEANTYAEMDRPEAKVKAEKDLAELRARKQFHRRLPEILGHINNLRRISNLQKAERSLVTTGITTKLNDLIGQVVTDELRLRLEEELRALNCGSLQVGMDTRGVKGKTHVALQLKATTGAVKVQDVLSEGEQRAVSLAFLFAEIGVAGHDGGVILDDPVSSLDHQRRARVAVRLVEEAKRRQVIVFTHELVFLHELITRAEEMKVDHVVQTVRRAAKVVGLVTADDLPWLAKNANRRVGVLKAGLHTLIKLEKDGADGYFGQAKLWVENLRETWERAVEERLLNGVIQRFNPAVQTQRLEKVKVRFTAELVEEVMVAMTETSKWVHDQAAALNTPPPTTDELTVAVEKIEGFLRKLPVS